MKYTFKKFLYLFGASAIFYFAILNVLRHLGSPSVKKEFQRSILPQSSSDSIFKSKIVKSSHSIFKSRSYSKRHQERIEQQENDANNVLLNSNEKYDVQLKGLKRDKLGFAVGPEFEIQPESWTDFLYDLKGKVQNPVFEHNLKIGDANGNFSSMLTTTTTTTALSSTPTQVPYLSSMDSIKPKTILIYGGPKWGQFKNRCPLQNYQLFECHYIDWYATKHKTSFRSMARNSDAILITRNNIDRSLLEQVYSNNYENEKEAEEIGKIQNLESRLGSVPKLIRLTLEAPIKGKGFQMSVNSAGNNNNKPRDILASYWRGSDIYMPLFKWKYFNKTKTTKYQVSNYAEGRTKMAAIVISNCHTANNRMGFIRELRKYIDIDVFGHCGSRSCFQCFDDIKKDYKFYLAFETTNCRNYITEKLSRDAYKNDLLPIVMGAHPSDYKAIAPQNSYIHVEDFKSTQELGYYLRLLNKNDTLYNSYFTWKGTGAFSSVYSNSFACEACAYLHAESLKQRPEYKLNTHANNNNHNVNANSSKLPVPAPYFNMEDKYNVETFNFNSHDQRLCLPPNRWHWNSRFSH